MSEFIVDPFLLVRSPAYSYENFNESFLQQALTTDFFRASMFFASQTLYIELRKKDFDYTQFNEQVKTTLWKYLNRMCFRPLPYGLFSSFSLAKWTTEQQPMSFVGQGQFTALPDFVAVLDYVNSLKTEELPAINYYVNNSMYTSARELYFVSQAYSKQDKHVIVHLKVVPGLKNLLKFISKGRTKNAILNYLIQQYGQNADVENYFNTLVQGHVIVSELMPNVTGILFNERCVSLLKQYPQLDLSCLRTFNIPVNDQKDALPELNKHIQEVIDRHDEKVPYGLYQREIAGGLNNEVHSEFVSLIKNLDKLTTDRDEDLMNIFKRNFLKKYDRQEVSLMEVMDPGIGIGYDNLASAFENQNDGFINDLRQSREPESKVKWGQIEKMLFEKWNNLSKSGLGKIILSQDDMNSISGSKSLLPPGMYILYKNVDRELWIDQIGGLSGIELGGRFGVPNVKIEQHLKKICEQEISINNDFIFAEIAFSPADKGSNIKQRGNFYPYEIPILTHPGRPQKNTIKLEDLCISISGNTILLRSVKLNKYIIPRLSCAYNTLLTTIPVFRFLCDLQYQGVKSSLGFSLESFFPGLDYYPRVQLGRAVLCPATWILKEPGIKQIVAGDDSYGEELNLPVCFSLNERDNFLVFNRNSKTDLEMFRKCIKNKKIITLKEYVFPDDADLYETQKKPQMSQYIACVINKSKSYPPPKTMANIIGDVKKLKVKRKFLLADEWLYFKLYAHSSQMDSILFNIVLPVLKEYKKNNPGFKWFFIRYNDPEHHIRLRFFTAKKSAYSLLAKLNEKLRPLSDSGKVSNILLDTYQRELERYSAELIDEIETLFYLDSEYILTAFQTNSSDTRFKLNFAVHSVILIVKCFIKDKAQRLEFFNIVFNSLLAEFSDADKEVERRLDLKYRNFRAELVKNEQFSVHKNNSVYLYLNQFLISLNEKLSNWKSDDKHSLLTSLIHMHINRIFEDNPREYECLTYHFMKKYQAYLNYTTNDEF